MYTASNALDIMNGLKPKINRGGANKPKHNFGSPIVIKSFTQNFTEFTDVDCALAEQFVNSASADEQLEIFKNILNGPKDLLDHKVIKFLAIVYYEAPAKHPVKCFLTRNVTKCSQIQQSFIELLSEYISAQLTAEVQFESYANVVPKVLTCIENFNSGAAAVKRINMELTQYLLDCSKCCFKDLRLPGQSPTKKNEIFIIVHSTMRLLVHIVQKLDSDPEYATADWYKTFQSMTYCIEQMISDEDVPMDTKCLSGILFLSVENLINIECEAWMKLLMGTKEEYAILSNKTGQLAVYSAIAASVPMDKLLQRVDDDTPAILELLHKLLNVVEGSGSDPALTLGAARSLAGVSRALPAVAGLAPPLLAFVWPHLEYHLDSVCHLALQLLANVVEYCAALERGADGVPGDSEPLEELLRSVRALGQCRSLYWACARGVAPLGAARVLRDLCAAPDVLHAAAAPHLQAAALAALEALLASGDARSAFDTWVEPALEAAAAGGAALVALEGLLPRAVRLHPDIVPYICSYMSTGVRPARVALACCRGAAACRARLPCGALRAAAVAADDETRVLALSLAVAARPAAAAAAAAATAERRDLALALTFLRYNIDSPSPNFRQLMLALYEKLLKRLEDSRRVLTRQGAEAEHCVQFVEQLRQLCLRAARRGASLARRRAALQLLAAAAATTWVWKEEHVEVLLQHLNDSYDCNRAFALQALGSCPVELLRRTYSTSLQPRELQRQAAVLRPTVGASAAYKLRLVAARLPERLPPGDCGPPGAAGAYAALRMLAAQVREELAAARRGGVAAAARRGAMFGALHCAAAILQQDRLGVRCWDPTWEGLAQELVALCVAVQEEVAPVVAAASPEGHLPPAGGRSPGDSEITLDDGRPVTAQMVLICAWRAVKEASAVLAELLAALPASQVALAEQCGQHYTALLGAAQHRGAVEQACVGFAALATRCWSCPELEHLPRAWLAAQLAGVARGAAGHATRRGAGVPFMIQTLTATEVRATGRGAALQRAAPALLQLAAARGAAAAERRVRAANILRALFRHAALAGATHAHVGAALRVAVCGFDANSWPERTAMSLLFAALLVRAFGVRRVRAAEAEAEDRRNTMTGRVFFQRYPALYDVMLNTLGEDSEAGDGALRPAAYPALLLLARIYPSALEGAASNLKLAAFVPCVLRVARRPVLHARRLAARAARALVPPGEYLAHVERMCSLVSAHSIPRNYCHGILLQLTQLLETPPALPTGAEAKVGGTLWILQQATSVRPCYLIAHEYVKVVNLLVWKFPKSVGDDLTAAIVSCLDALLFTALPPPLALGRDLCLADCLYLYLVLLHIGKDIDPIVQLTLKSLRHTSYEVVLSALNYLLILHDDLDVETDEMCKFREHLTLIRDNRVLDTLRENKTYLATLYNGFHDGKYPECRQKCLRLLTLEKNTQKLVINDANVQDEDLIIKLIQCVENEHENVTHLYLHSLLEFVSGKVDDTSLNMRSILFVLRTAFDQSSAVNSDSTRGVVVSFLETNLDNLMTMNLQDLSLTEKFEFKATVLATLVTLLEDDDDEIRQRAADVALKLARSIIPENMKHGDVILDDVALDDAIIPSRVTLDDVSSADGGILPSVCGELLRDYIESMEHSAALFVVLALLDFKSEVVMTDELNDECRVFDQSERYNIFLDESVWTDACVDKIIKNYKQKEVNLVEFVLSVVHDTTYSLPFEKLCQDNLVLFETMARDGFANVDETVNPKIEQFIRKLRSVPSTDELDK